MTYLCRIQSVGGFTPQVELYVMGDKSTNKTIDISMDLAKEFGSRLYKQIYVTFDSDFKKILSWSVP